MKPDDYLNRLSATLSLDNADELLTLIRRAVESCKANNSAEEFADSLGLQKGVSGFVNHTVPVVIHVWLRHQHRYREGILEIVRCGGGY